MSSDSVSHPEDESKELLRVLDEELNRLPEKYRAPLVLRYLAGKSNEEAARLLGWPPDSISYRLACGRELLRKRLLTRLAKAAIPLSDDAFADHLQPAAVPSSLALKTVDAAITLVGAKMPAAVAGFLSSSVRDLMQKTLRSLASSRRRWWLAVFFLGLTVSSLEGAEVWVRAVSDRCEGCQEVEIIPPRERHPRVHLYWNDPSHPFPV